MLTAQWYDTKLEAYLTVAKDEFERMLSGNINGSVTFNFSGGALNKVHTQEYKTPVL